MSQPGDAQIAWIALSLLPQSSAALAGGLTAARGDPEAALRALAGFEARARLEEAARLRDSLPGRGLSILTPDGEGYPHLLREIADPPPALYVRGEILADDDPAVALIGSRQATPYGLAVARYLGEELGRGGVTVISGLARGIDAAAHQGLLQAPSGRGLAVLGCGLDRIYPPEHRQLGEALAARGALISEFPPGTAPLPRNFPQRNRLISGLARAVVVVQAAAGSGSLITARLALDQGREVFAVPGPITASSSQGSNELIHQGARPVATARDIVEEFPAAVRGLVARRLAVRRSGPPPDLTPAEGEVWKELDPAEPRGVDALAAATGLGVTDLVAALLGLEIRGLAQALPGGRYIRGGWTGGGGSLY